MCILGYYHIEASCCFLTDAPNIHFFSQITLLNVYFFITAKRSKFSGSTVTGRQWRSRQKCGAG